MFPRSVSAECSGCGKSSHPNSYIFFSFPSFFFFALALQYSDKRCLARIQCYCRLINRVIYQQRGRHEFFGSSMLFFETRAFVCIIFSTNLSAFSSLLLLTSFIFTFYPCLWFVTQISLFTLLPLITSKLVRASFARFL